MTTARDIKQQILALVESSIEDTRVPDAIAAHADKRAGKTVTKTDAEQLEAQLGVPVRIRRQYGMTHVAWTVDAQRQEHTLRLGYSESGTRWPTGQELRHQEPAYFAARDERNEARKKVLADPSLVTRAAAAVAKMHEAREELEKLLDYGQPLAVVRFDVQKIANKDA